MGGVGWGGEGLGGEGWGPGRGVMKLEEEGDTCMAGGSKSIYTYNLSLSFPPPLPSPFSLCLYTEKGGERRGGRARGPEGGGKRETE